MDSTAQVIDVRTPDEYRSGNIAGDQNINFFDKYFQEQIKLLDLNKRVCIYCAAAGRSRKAYKVIESLGSKVIYDLKGGHHK
jgi:rhodanese-related sulfurtransferase